VVKIDQDSGQLAKALAGEQARIIITTLQKLPFVIDKIGAVPARNYAVVIDEAHSSQTGEAAKDLRLTLGASSEQELTAAEATLDRVLPARPAQRPRKRMWMVDSTCRGHCSRSSRMAAVSSAPMR
jgi:type I restriction enzyme, R subunit